VGMHGMVYGIAMLCARREEKGWELRARWDAGLRGRLLPAPMLARDVGARLVREMGAFERALRAGGFAREAEIVSKFVLHFDGGAKFMAAWKQLGGVAHEVGLVDFGVWGRAAWEGGGGGGYGDVHAVPDRPVAVSGMAGGSSCCVPCGAALPTVPAAVDAAPRRRRVVANVCVVA
jgi:hypothetical protein